MVLCTTPAVGVLVVDSRDLIFYRFRIHTLRQSHSVLLSTRVARCLTYRRHSVAGCLDVVFITPATK